MAHHRHTRVALSLVGCISMPVPAADGDINTDGTVDAADVLWGQQVILEGRVLTPAQFSNGDLTPLRSGTPDPDGFFDSSDLSLVTRIALGLLDYSAADNHFTIGDSIGEGEAADGSIGAANHDKVWSTGYHATDGVDSFNERFEAIDAAGYQQNNAVDDTIFNHAVSGAEMVDFVAQAQNVITASTQTLAGTADTVSVLLGSNDVCAADMASMTDPAVFEAQYRAGLDTLAASPATRAAQIHVSSIPAIYWLWYAKKSNFLCRVFIWPLVPCQNLLDDPADDCADNASAMDPDNVHPGDGSACLRRKQFHDRIKTDYNPVLRDTLAEYRDDGRLPNARYIDIFDTPFSSVHVNGGDCFHPSTAGHALLAGKEWCLTHWGIGDPACSE